MTSTIVNWPSGSVQLRWVPQPYEYAEPVTAVHCFCFTDGRLVLVDVAERGLSIPGGHVDDGERLTAALRREFVEEACIVLGEPVLLGAIECNHSGNPQLVAAARYPRLASQLLYAGMVSDLMPFEPSAEVSDRVLVPAAECPRRHHEWNVVLQAAFEAALDWASTQRN